MDRKFNIESKDSNGYNSLILASNKGHGDVVELLDRGADILGVEIIGLTSPHWSCFKGHRVVVELLLVRSVDMHPTDFSGRTPSQLAISAGNVEIANTIKEWP